MSLRSVAILVGLVAAALAIGPSRVESRVLSTDAVVTANASLAGTLGGSFNTYTYTALEPCGEYTLRLSYTMMPSGTPVENAIGFQIWNNNGSADLTSEPLGDRHWYAPALRYYLQSVRLTTMPSYEEVRFKVACTDTNPSYTFKTFNYQPGSSMSYTLSLPGTQGLPGGQEN